MLQNLFALQNLDVAINVVDLKTGSSTVIKAPSVEALNIKALMNERNSYMDFQKGITYDQEKAMVQKMIDENKKFTGHGNYLHHGGARQNQMLLECLNGKSAQCKAYKDSVTVHYKLQNHPNPFCQHEETTNIQGPGKCSYDTECKGARTCVSGMCAGTDLC